MKSVVIYNTSVHLCLVTKISISIFTFFLDNKAHSDSGQTSDAVTILRVN